MRSQLIEEKVPQRGFSVPANRSEGHGNGGLEVTVVYTTERRTLATLKTAGELAYDLGARINLIALLTVPWTLPLTRPSVPVTWTEQHLFDLVCAAASPRLDTDVHVYLCRDKRRALLKALRPKSLVVIGDKMTWWPSEATRMAKTLEHAGHRVIFARPR